MRSIELRMFFFWHLSSSEFGFQLILGFPFWVLRENQDESPIFTQTKPTTPTPFFRGPQPYEVISLTMIVGPTFLFSVWFQVSIWYPIEFQFDTILQLFIQSSCLC